MLSSAGLSHAEFRLLPGGSLLVERRHRHTLSLSEMPVPPESVRNNAKRGLALRQEYGRGGTEVGVARARDLSRGANISISTIKRMVSYFARHEVDKKGKGWSAGSEGYPSAGRIAWLLWGGDAGRAWANSEARKADRLNKYFGY